MRNFFFLFPTNSRIFYMYNILLFVEFSVNNEKYLKFKTILNFILDSRKAMTVGIFFTRNNVPILTNSICFR